MTEVDPSGRRITHLEVPGEKWTANVAFRGPDRQTLFITASTRLYPVRMRTRGAKLYHFDSDRDRLFRRTAAPSRHSVPVPRDAGFAPPTEDRCRPPRSPREVAPQAHLTP